MQSKPAIGHHLVLALVAAAFFLNINLVLADDRPDEAFMINAKKFQ